MLQFAQAIQQMTKFQGNFISCSVKDNHLSGNKARMFKQRDFCLICLSKALHMPKPNQEMALAFYLLFILLRLPSGSGSDEIPTRSCGGGNYTSNSTYRSNLNNLLTFFASLDSTSFTNQTVGSIPDTVYGLILCRGDISSSDCTSCIQNAARDVLSLCPGSKQATVWYAYCELRYSDLRFFSTFQNPVLRIIYIPQNVMSRLEDFVRAQRQLLDEIVFEVAYNSSLMFATGTATNGSDVTVNGLAQCTRDLSEDKCSRCLKEIRAAYTNRGYEAKPAGRVLGDSCNFRYEVDHFFRGDPTVLLDLSAPPPPPSTHLPSGPTSAGGEGSKSNPGKVLSIVFPVVAVIVMLTIGVCIFLWKKRLAKKGISSTLKPEEISSLESLLIDLTTLKIATENFSNANKLGEGGFGSVYKGKLAHGAEIAVKRLSASSTQGVQELKNELLLVAKLQHRNLVKLLGVCLEEEEKLLVYEYVPNRSLDKFLFDPIRCKELNWDRRFNIIGGIARGLSYLHEESHVKVIHRDMKASNILLSAEMNPKISDFGLARLFGGDEIEGTTNRVVGTFGYMAPEYVLHGHFSPKVDVFSFGVLALEIVTGRRCNSFYNSQHPRDFLDYIWEAWSKGTVLEIVDPSMETYRKNEGLRCIHIALLCVQEAPKERPLMSSVVLMLHSPTIPLQPPLQPRIFHGMGNYNSVGDGFASTALKVSVNEVSITQMQPR